MPHGQAGSSNSLIPNQAEEAQRIIASRPAADPIPQCYGLATERSQNIAIESTNLGSGYHFLLQ